MHLQPQVSTHAKQKDAATEQEVLQKAQTQIEQHFGRRGWLIFPTKAVLHSSFQMCFHYNWTYTAQGSRGQTTHGPTRHNPDEAVASQFCLQVMYFSPHLLTPLALTHAMVLIPSYVETEVQLHSHEARGINRDLQYMQAYS